MVIHMSYDYLSVIIVDDEASIRNGLASSIPWEQIGLHVVGIASDGNEALSMIRGIKPHIVITDIRMPICDGLDLIRFVREENLPCKFIILSGYDDFKYAQTAIKYHVNSYLLKPIQLEELKKELISLKDLTLEEMKKDNSLQNTKDQLQQHTDTLQNHFCLKLLNNEYKVTKELENHIISFKVPLKNIMSRVLVFSYRSLEKETAGSAIPIQNLLISAIETSFQSYTHRIVIKDIHTIVLILNHNEGETSMLERLHVHCKEVLKQMKAYPLFSLHIGVGETVDSLLNTNTSYLLALEAVSYSIYQTEQRIFDSETIKRVTAPIISPNPKTNQKLVDAIYECNKKELNHLLYEFFHSLFYVEIPPPHYIRGMCTFLIIDVQNGLSNYYEEISQLFVEIPYVEINKIESFREIREWITVKFISYADFMKTNASFANDPIIQKAKAYIKDNIFNKIKAENVASHVGLSENYFTVYFKEKTSANFKTYVQNLKMEKAKEYLKTSNIRISELSSMLGYEDYRSFNKAFKKEMGMAPSEYYQKYHSR